MENVILAFLVVVHVLSSNCNSKILPHPMGPTYRPIVIPMTATIEIINKSKINLNLTIPMTLDKSIPL